MLMSSSSDSSLPCTQGFVTILFTLPLAGALASHSLEPRANNNKLFSLGETFANLRAVRFDSDGRAFAMSIGENMSFEDTKVSPVRSSFLYWQDDFPHRPEAAPPRSVTAALAPLREALCLSSRRSSSLPSSSQRRAAASFLYGVDSCDWRCQPLPLRSAPTVPTLPSET